MVIDLLLTFTLEVLGAIGAIWGSSEVFGLRGVDTFWGFNIPSNTFWRLIACVIGILAFHRWAVRQLVMYRDIRKEDLTPASPTEQAAATTAAANVKNNGSSETVELKPESSGNEKEIEVIEEVELQEVRIDEIPDDTSDAAVVEVVEIHDDGE